LKTLDDENFLGENPFNADSSNELVNQGIFQHIKSKNSDWVHSFALKKKRPYTFGLGKRSIDIKI